MLVHPQCRSTINAIIESPCHVRHVISQGDVFDTAHLARHAVRQHDRMSSAYIRYMKDFEGVPRSRCSVG
jgi:hypothetical protein